MDSKNVIAKLVKIASAQQKIISKLAQMIPEQQLAEHKIKPVVGGTDMTTFFKPIVESILKATPGAQVFSLKFASFDDAGVLDLTLLEPSDMPSMVVANKALQTQLVGKQYPGLATAISKVTVKGATL